MSPEAHGRDLLYVSQGELVYVYTYPRGKLVGWLATGASFMCVDNDGYIYMPTNFGSTVEVYAHGATTPYASLGDPYFPDACTVDPTTRNVAVMGNLNNAIVLFPYRRHGWRFPKLIADPNLQYAAYGAYDAHGNLFIDGVDSGGNFALDEMPKGTRTFQRIAISQAITTPGGMQRDGKYLAIADRGEGSLSQAVVYRFSINGSSATEISSSKLQQSYAHAQFWIQGGRIIGAVVFKAERGIGVWNFPEGGSPTKVFADSTPFGAVVSPK